VVNHDPHGCDDDHVFRVLPAVLVVYDQMLVPSMLGEVAPDDTGQPRTLERARSMRGYWVTERVTWVVCVSVPEVAVEDAIDLRQLSVH
jgi:hypothetical protein